MGHGSHPLPFSRCKVDPKELALAPLSLRDYIWGVLDEQKQNYQHLRDRADHFFGTAQRR